jgi:hypothetical protein
MAMSRFMEKSFDFTFNYISSISTVNQAYFPPLTVVLFIYSIINNAFSTSDYTVLNERVTVKNELGRLWMEAGVA